MSWTGLPRARLRSRPRPRVRTTTRQAWGAEPNCLSVCLSERAAARVGGSERRRVRCEQSRSERMRANVTAAYA
eukprot:scaffold100688_cov48-Phaeocystis_antarctica.AAC.3